MFHHIATTSCIPSSLLFPKSSPRAYPNSFQSLFRGSHQISIVCYWKQCAEIKNKAAQYYWVRLRLENSIGDKKKQNGCTCT